MAETMTRSHVGTLYDKGNNPIMHVCQKSPDCDACQRGIPYGVEDAASLRHFSIETLQVMLHADIRKAIFADRSDVCEAISPPNQDFPTCFAVAAFKQWIDQRPVIHLQHCDRPNRQLPSMLEGQSSVAPPGIGAPG